MSGNHTNGQVPRRGFIQTAASGMAAASLARQAAAAAKKPPKRAKDKAPKNLIFIVADTFRADHIGCYGSQDVKTPHLDRLAEQAILFENAYADGLPTIPCRRVYHTGKSIVPMRKHGGWIPMKRGKPNLAKTLRRKGFRTGFIVDTYHHFKPGMNFHRHFDSWQWIRGQESDPYRCGPREEIHPKTHMPNHLWHPAYDRRIRQYLMNTHDFASEDDYFCARTLDAGLAWLKRNAGRKGRCFLFLDTFDPHEPWDAPPRFQKMYRDRYPADRTMFGYGVRNKDIRPDDLPWIRALYAAECSFVDDRVGKFVEGLRTLGLLDDTVLVFSTDHGTHLGEKGCVQKTPALLNSCVAQLPLIVRHPDPAFAGKRVKALVSAADYFPSFLDMLGVEHKLPLDGKSWWPLVTGEAESLHERVVTEFHQFAAVRDHRWCYFQSTRGKNAFQPKTIQRHAAKIKKGAPGVPHLLDLAQDPAELNNVVLDHPDVAGAMQKHLAQRCKT